MDIVNVTTRKDQTILDWSYPFKIFISIPRGRSYLTSTSTYKSRNYFLSQISRKNCLSHIIIVKVFSFKSYCDLQKSMFFLSHHKCGYPTKKPFNMPLPELSRLCLEVRLKKIRTFSYTSKWILTWFYPTQFHDSTPAWCFHSYHARCPRFSRY